MSRKEELKKETPQFHRIFERELSNKEYRRLLEYLNKVRKVQQKKGITQERERIKKIIVKIKESFSNERLYSKLDIEEEIEELLKQIDEK